MIIPGRDEISLNETVANRVRNVKFFVRGADFSAIISAESVRVAICLLRREAGVLNK